MANRANAQKSTGPRTEAGKEKVAQNPARHGLCGKFQVLSCEDQSGYEALLANFIQTEQPANPVEHELVVKMARHTWLSQRALRFQDACFLVQPQTSEDEKNNSDGVAVRDVDLAIYMRYHVQHDRADQPCVESAKGADARRQTMKQLASSLGGVLGTATVLRVVLQKSCKNEESKGLKPRLALLRKNRPKPKKSATRRGMN